MENDTRTSRFLAKYGELYAVELDALTALIPEDFKNMVLQKVDQFFDETIRKEILAQYSSKEIAGFVKRKVKQLEAELYEAEYDNYN